MDLSKKWVMVVIAIFCSVLWGSAFPALKLTYAELQVESSDVTAQMVLAGIRFLIAGLIVIIGLLIFNRSALIVTRSQWGVLLLFGVIQTSLQYLFFYIGVSNTTGIQSAIITSSNTFFTILIAHFIYSNDRLNWQKCIGLFAGFIGIIVANWGQSFDANFTLTGEGFMFLSAFTSAVGTIMAKQMGKGIHPFALSGWQLTIGALILLVIAVPFLPAGSFHFTPLAIGLLIYMALLSAVAFALWYSILMYHKASHVGIYKFFVPVSGVGLSIMLLPGESFSIQIAFALIFVALGIYLVNRK
ncbi:DMT family transporter [Psychrobacillus sp.]|uniref:DMT family transporter n=1 Tax=Psychrobacillus sp. TaxID=1871623 RepID=UPI0028BF3899|nr:DMT family transporter [Psychrobacillus sp.]